MAKRIFDCFSFFNELEVLEIRLNTMAEHVDFVVLAESNRTHQNTPKELHYENNKARFAQFHDKIIHVIVDDMPDAANAKSREHHQRRAIGRGLTQARPDDVVIISDVDEILRPSTLAQLREQDGYFLFDMPMYQFYLNARAIDAGWNKSFAFSYRLADRVPDWNFVRVLQQETFDKFAGENHLIRSAGWHFTFLGGAERVTEKLNSYIHRDQVPGDLLTGAGAAKRLASGYDINGTRMTRFVEIDDTYPAYIRDNLDLFVARGFVKPLGVRVKELESMFAVSENKRRALIHEMREALAGIKAAGTPDDIAAISARCDAQLESAWRAD